MAGFAWPAVAGRPGVVYSSAINTVGTRATDTDGKEFIFLKGVASTVTGSWVSFDELGVTALLDSDVAATLISHLAVASAAIVADKYGWYQICGAVSALVASASADNAKLYANAQAGIADDTAVTGNQIHGAYTRGAVTTDNALCTVQLMYPFIGVTDAII